VRSTARLGHTATLVAWVAGAAAVLGTLVAAGVSATIEGPLAGKPLLLPLVWMVPGVLIAAARPRWALGWLLLAVALMFVGIGLAGAVVSSEAAGDRGTAWALWYVDRASALLVPCALLALVLLPDGRLPSRAWRPFVTLLVGVQVLVIGTFSLLEGPAAGPDSTAPAAVRDLANPVGVLPSGWADAVAGVDVWLLQLPMLLVPVALAHRVVRAAPDQRPRLVTLMLASAIFAAMLVVGHLLWPATADLLDVLGSVLLVAVVTTTVLGPRREIELVVHHAVVFAVLTLTVTGLYVAATALAAAAGADLPPAGAGLLAALAAVALLPVRARLLDLVGRLLYGDRRDPYAALTRLASSTHRVRTAEEAVREVATSVAASLRVPYVRVEVAGAATELGHRPAGGQVQSAPLVSGELPVGTVTTGFTPSRRWRRDDTDLLHALGRHAGMAVHAVTLAEELRSGRQQLVAAREEERRRVGRNLHDGLGPTLAAITMQLGSVRQRLTPGSREEVRLGRLEAIAREALAELRRVARELRPTGLDQFGLAEALRRHAEEIGLQVEVVSDVGRELPAGVEVAAYRIGQQALGNVAAHADVTAAELRLGVRDGRLELVVGDRGRGFADAAEGVGTSSMRERAEELGGSCTVRSGPGGTLVTALLPLTGLAREVEA
jgi:signal transduction histidine kinase